MKLNCHCGAIQIQVAQKPNTLTSCNCSICNRYGALWGYYETPKVSINASDSGLSHYSWGEESIDYYRCNKCACVTHYETNEKIEKNTTAINFRMAEPSTIESITIRKFDGADTWSYFD